MKPTRQMQPYRQSAQRAPSPILDAMRAGRAKGAHGAALMHAANVGLRKKRPKNKMIPRSC